MFKDKEKKTETFSRNTENTPGGSSDMDELVGAFLNGSAKAAARIVTLAENRDPLFFELIKILFPHTGKAYVIGITGAPGTGKSTLTDVLAALLRER